MVSIDITKFILSLFVVLLHINGTIFQGIPVIDTINQWFGAFAVPCFLVYSGYFFGLSTLKRPLARLSWQTVKRLVILSLVYQSIWLIFLMDNGSIITRFIASDDRFMFIIDCLYHLFCDGLYQFWYITAALMGIIWMAVCIHFKVQRFGFIVSVMMFICAILISTWWIPGISEALMHMVKPMDIVMENVAQSGLCAWIFLWIGYGYSHHRSWFDNYRYSLFGLTIVLTVVEITIYCLGYGHALSLWMVSPLVSLMVLMLTVHHPTNIPRRYGLWLRHASTLIYCIHYQLVIVFSNWFTQGIAIYHPLLTPLMYFSLLGLIVIGIEYTITRLTSHNRHHWLTYLF